MTTGSAVTKLLFYDGCKGCEATKRIFNRVQRNHRAMGLLERIHWLHLERTHQVEPFEGELALCKIPMVSHSRARLLLEIGIKSISDIACADPERLCQFPKVKRSTDTSFPTVVPLIVNYARAICENKTLIVGQHALLPKTPKPPYFMDLEYDPEGTRNRGRVGIFLYGILDSEGNVTQRFLNDPRQEKEFLEWFSDWLSKTKPSLITYSSKSADEPHLRNSLQKYDLPTNCLSQTLFLDLFYEVIFTQSPKNQKIFLPIKGSIESKRVAHYFGYREPSYVRIRNGLDALAAYKRYLRTESEEIRNDLLAYNRCDLERTALIYTRLREMFDKHSRNEKQVMCQTGGLRQI